ncbi:Uncharacterised protein [Raoultella terrigena]|uniref:Uncharacterized protein n=1 Tax=Raoultella terrigena TaxID=577 RepID=A0A3P8KZ67_RAOTE|nr:Uncharacterised protein [Raoultella terrigena]
MPPENTRASSRPINTPALGGTDHPPLLVRSGGAGGIGNQPLRHRGAQQAHRQHADQQHKRRRCGADRRQRGDQQDQLRAHQPTAI